MKSIWMRFGLLILGMGLILATPAWSGDGRGTDSSAADGRGRTSAAKACRAARAAGTPDVPPLFDGHSLDNWMTLDGQPVTRGWEVVDGVIHLKKEKRRAGHIVTRDVYGDFDLSFEWKIAKRGNSGVKYRVRNYGNKMLGCEYQILDDRSNGAGVVRTKGSAGALYALFAPNENKALRPVGEFNTARIVVRGNRIEHWLNGKLIVSATVGDESWNQAVAESKFSDDEGFGENTKGRIMLTDHGSEVWFRNFHFHTE